MTLTGKGFYIWKVRNCESGDANAIVHAAQQANLSHVIIKVADGDRSYNYDTELQVDLVAPVARLLMDAGIQVWGWQYIYGENPVSEARRAIQRLQELNLDGFVVNAEVEFKEAGKEIAARKYMTELRNALPDLPIALSSFRFPSYHPMFPFDDFLEFCDFNMPQVYWVMAHNPATQLERTLREFQARKHVRPIIPTGAAYKYGDWEPTTDDVNEFLSTARKLKMNAANFWSWDYSRIHLPEIWNTVADYSWPNLPQEKDISELFIDILNSHDVVKLATMYTPRGIHIQGNRAVQGPGEILKWYHTFLNQTFPGGIFKLTGVSGTGNSRHFTWAAVSTHGAQIANGNDTIGLRDGKISYHYKYFTIDKEQLE